MGFFDFLKSAPRADRNKAIAAVMKGKRAYDARNFAEAAKYFSEYFDYKGFGNFPDLDSTDFRMYLNLMVSRLYARQYRECLEVCNTLIRLDPSRSDAYAFSGLCYYKLGDKQKAEEFWKKAKSRGNEIAKTFDCIEDVRMQGFSD